VNDSPEAQLMEINRLRVAHDAIILAHNYQNDEVQQLADHVGDSLALSRIAAQTTAQIIVFCGVHFMAESAAILAPDKTILLPAETASCPMAKMADAETVLQWRQTYPKAAVVTYINSSAAVKAVSDYCCTSANAVALVKNIPESELIFLPDQNLGRFVARQIPQKTIHLWPGYCITHHRITADDVLRIKALHPHVPVLVHPECQEEVVTLADFAGSTAEILRHVRDSAQSTFIIGTEMGILYSLQTENPTKTFYLLNPGLICPNMKQTTAAKVLSALRNLRPVITVPPEIRNRARRALDRMLDYTS
jgi:quinolinate synthase